jgi:type IV pilus assembly protein PilP
LRSPFSVPSVPEDVNRLNTNGLDIRPDPDRVREYLEQFAIDTLDMVGTLQKPEGDLWALIRDGEGGVVKVRKGEYMGRNHGRVVSVDNDRVNLIEIVPDGQGGWLERPRTLALNGAPGE